MAINWWFDSDSIAIKISNLHVLRNLEIFKANMARNDIFRYHWTLLQMILMGDFWVFCLLFFMDWTYSEIQCKLVKPFPREPSTWSELEIVFLLINDHYVYIYQQLNSYYYSINAAVYKSIGVLYILQKPLRMLLNFQIIHIN